MENTEYDIKSMTPSEVSELIVSLGDKKFRAKQIYQWMHQKLVASYDEMTNVPAALRQKLAAEYPLTVLEPVRVQISQIDGTRKYLFRLSDGNLIESVLMKYHHGNSVCISSQVGCRMGCRFCASTIDGLVRGLLPSEMLEQIYRIQKDIGERVDNVVVMAPGNHSTILIICFDLLSFSIMKKGLTSAHVTLRYRHAESYLRYMNLRICSHR